jgi:hypothetical protein
MHRLALVHDKSGIRKVTLARGPVRHPRRVIGVHVREEHGVDTRGVDAGGPDVGQDLAGGGQQIVARSGVDQRQTSCGINQECIHGGSARRPERCRQDAGGFIDGDVAQDLHRPIEKAVADGGDDNVADATVIDAGNLLPRNVDHRSIHFLMERL